MTVVQRKKELKSKVMCFILCLSIQLICIVPLAYKVTMDDSKLVENTQTESESQSELPTESEEVFIEESTNAVVMLPEVSEIESEIVIETEVEAETTTETEFEFVSISFIPIEIQKLCFEIGGEYHISPELLIAIIERESGGDANAVNPVTGCKGAMQLHPAYADYYLEKAGCSDPFNPEHNIRAGCEILTEKFEQYYELPLVLMQYHGESKATKRFKSGKYSKYCIGIMERMEEMQEVTGG